MKLTSSIARAILKTMFVSRAGFGLNSAKSHPSAIAFGVDQNILVCCIPAFGSGFCGMQTQQCKYLLDPNRSARYADVCELSFSKSRAYVAYMGEEVSKRG